ncbi:hypothetical protein M0208_15670 [Sphingomonas sp. SUN019]|uniref:hypothetical protein n=1 Tax=Sphingomonas sp. SUN019 TaxID=2937788 RepID=UPI002164B46B|nr:hypothetical protein [Sphingomonas sp. SUN019]UVO51880.1 hypothetical protein M0208_15670 [Sphingomonas sp. SUN019]
MASIPAAVAHPNELSATQLAIVATIGATLWFLAALLIRAVEPFGALEGTGVAIFYALIIPGTVPFIPLIRRLAALRRDKTVYGVAVATGVAGLLDGLALAYFPALYGANTAGAGAAILWGAGVALMLAVVMSRGR